MSRLKNVFSSRVFFPKKVFVPEKKSIKNGGQAEPLRKLMILHVIQWETHSVSKCVSKRHQSTKKIKGLDFLYVSFCQSVPVSLRLAVTIIIIGKVSFLRKVSLVWFSVYQFLSVSPFQSTAASHNHQNCQVTRPNRPIRWIVKHLPTNRQTDPAGYKGVLAHLKSARNLCTSIS